MHLGLHQIKQIVGILLAAGHSRRFGNDDKLLQPLSDSQIMAISSAKNLQQALPNSFAIVRNPALIKMLKTANIPLIPCPPDAKEMADSLAVAIKHAHTTLAAEAYVVALADMPYIKPETIAALAGGLAAGASIVIPTYQGQRGHPVGFSAKFTEELLQLKGDEGARSIIKKYSDDVTLISCEDAGVLRDIDIPDDLKIVDT